MLIKIMYIIEKQTNVSCHILMTIDYLLKISMNRILFISMHVDIITKNPRVFIRGFLKLFNKIYLAISIRDFSTCSAC